MLRPASAILLIVSSCHQPAKTGGLVREKNSLWVCLDANHTATRKPFEGFTGSAEEATPGVRQLFGGVGQELRKCVDTAQATGRSTDGDLAYQLSFDERGSVAQTCVSPSSGLDQGLLVCLAGQLERIQVGPSLARRSVGGALVPARLPARPVRPAAGAQPPVCSGQAPGIPLSSPGERPGPRPGNPAPPGSPASNADRVIAGARERARQCYVRALNLDAGQEGRVAFALSVDGQGVVVGLCTARAGLDDVTQSCIAEALGALRFSAADNSPKGGTVSGSFSFVNSNNLPPWPFVTFVTQVGGP